MEVRGLFHAPAALTPRKNPQYSLNEKLYEPDGLEASRSWTGRGEEKTPEFEPRILYSITQSVYCLRYPSCCVYQLCFIQFTYRSVTSLQANIGYTGKGKALP